MTTQLGKRIWRVGDQRVPPHLRINYASNVEMVIEGRRHWFRANEPDTKLIKIEIAWHCDWCHESGRLAHDAVLEPLVAIHSRV